MRPLLKLTRDLLVIALLGVSLLLVTELAFRAVSGPNVRQDPYIVFTDSLSVLSKTEINGRERYKFHNPKVYRALNVTFPVRKPPRTVRIFCLGGSAAAGWPHPPEESYPEYLKRYLSLALPDRRFEVHNVAAHAQASYRVRMIFDQVIEADPDLLIVYSGNNEFVEERTYAISGLHGAVQVLATRSLLVQRLRGLTASSWLPDDMTLPGGENKKSARWIWGSALQIANPLHTDPEQFAMVLRHYSYSMEHMQRQARERGVPILFLTVPTNLRDWHPVVSEHGLDSGEADAWKERYEDGRRFLFEGENEAARRSMEEAARLAPAHAATHFYLGRALESLGRGPEALEAYRAAKDFDRNGWRALTVFNDTLRRLGREDEGVGLIDVERVFEQSTEGVAPGFDLFLDYVHPTKTGNLLIARSILRWILEEGGGAIAPPAADGRYAAALEAYSDSGYRDEDDLGMLHNLATIYGLMHQYEAFVELADAILPEVDSGDTSRQKRLRMIREDFVGYLAAERSELLGEPFDPDYREKHKIIFDQMLVGEPPSRPES
jgi:tetratricopeptide (TPR) repeat protein